MTFYKPTNQKRLRKFLQRKGFEITEGGSHCVAKHPLGTTISFPRHNDISNGVTKKVCDKLVELGFDKEEIEKALIK